MKNIYTSICNAMAEIDAIGKDSQSPQGYKYRGVDAVMNTLNPVLIKNKIFCVPSILEQAREERQTAKGGNLIYSILKMKFTFFAEDGSSVDAIVIGEGMDSGDKASNKAMSVAFKYACFQLFCIPTEEMQDPDKDHHETAPKEPPKPKCITEKEVDEIEKLLDEKGIDAGAILATYNVNTFNEMIFEQYENCIKRLKASKDKAVS